MAAPGLYGHAYRQLRAQVLAEEDTCHICHKPVDKTIKGRHPAAPSLDHVQPRSRGGSHFDRANARLAHYGCNSRKKNHMPGQRRRTTSRAW